MQDPNDILQVEEKLLGHRVSKRDGRVTNEGIEEERRWAPIIMAPFLIPYYVLRFAFRTFSKLKPKPKKPANRYRLSR